MEDLKTLIEKIKGKDENAFDLFYDNTKKPVYFYIKNYIKDDSLASEVLQEVYFSFFKNIKKIEGDKNILSWLITVAVNKSINLLKRKKEVSPFIEEEFICLSEDRTIWQTLKKELSPEEYSLIILRFIYGYSQTEIASKKGMPISTINKRFKTLLEKIKEIIKE